LDFFSEKREAMIFGPLSMDPTRGSEKILERILNIAFRTTIIRKDTPNPPMTRDLQPDVLIRAN